MPRRGANAGRTKRALTISQSLRLDAIDKHLQLLDQERLLLSTKEKILDQRITLFEQSKQNQVRLFLDSVPCLVAEVDQHQCFRFCNKFFADFFGVPRTEIVGKRLWEVFKESDYDAIRPSLVIALAGDDATFDRYIAGKRRRYVHGTVSPRRDCTESFSGLFLFLVDITERKAWEDKRTALLKQAKEASKLKDHFLATLSHELRTPLTSIVGWSALINDGQLTPEQASMGMNVIERNARIQTRLIEDLLDVSRIMAGKLQLQITDVNMPDLVRQEVDSIKPAMTEKGIEIRTRISGQPIPPFRGDAGRLRQVIDNLLSNALKFTPPGGHVTIDLKRTKTNVQVVVKDDGPGIPDGALAHIFDEFRQADMSPTRSKGGLGLGLSIARHLVELHRGSICAENRKPGAAFFVTLPISPSPPDS